MSGLTVLLTPEDMRDLKAGNSINALTSGGPEVVLDPNDFEAPVWVLLEAGGKFIVESNICESSATIEVHVMLEQPVLAPSPPARREEVDNVVRFTTSAQQAYGEAVTMIANAYAWAQCADLSYDEAMAEDGQAGYRIQGERNAAVRNMERSLYANLAHLLTGPQAYDGPVEISRDGDCSFFWIHDGPANWVPAPGQTEQDKPRYHGGLIFHKDHHFAADVRVGTWSIHT